MVSTAVEIWKSRCYNIRSQFSMGRLVLGRKHGLKQAGDKPTMSEFATARRRAVGLATQNASSPIVSKRKLQELTAHAWTPSMQAEESHMKKKRAARLIEVTAAGGIPPLLSLLVFLVPKLWTCTPLTRRAWRRPVVKSISASSLRLSRELRMRCTANPSNLSQLVPQRAAGR